ncbi:PaeR7I family type II restriction endonuclease [Curvibacter lanceolatus]|uniref:PaeR7I family type II restriction endonuclease n=1 Tax=Curvibacter lanceolatus TaxID=86182 RepID=UPI00247FD870|nr:PaeR7I family type II restriction endonuclease [Curvibacter lanceolatus]
MKTGAIQVVEDAPKSRAPVRESSPHFPVLAEFAGASYLQRYDLLCKKLMQEQLYSSASLMATPRSGGTDGTFSDMSTLTSLKSFVASLAGHVASQAAK